MSFEDLRARARGHWDQLVPALAPDPDVVAAIERGPGRHGPCPVHGGENGDAFRVFSDFPLTGGACCNTCGTFPTGMALLQWLHGWEWAKVADAVEKYLDGPEGGQQRSAVRKRTVVKTPRDRAPEMRVLKRIWGEACGYRGTAAGPLRRYLAGRGLDGLNPLPCVRFHPRLLYCEGEKRTFWPGMLARIFDPMGTWVGLHRTYLDPWGNSKAGVRAPKKMLHARGKKLTGGAVRLYQAGSLLGVAEGIETAIAVQKATGMPVWAATSGALVRAIRIPRRVKRLVIWADRDKAGRKAAMKAAERLEAAGLPVAVHYPQGLPAGSDWLDVLQNQGVDGFPGRFRRAG